MAVGAQKGDPHGQNIDDWMQYVAWLQLHPEWYYMATMVSSPCVSLPISTISGTYNGGYLVD